MALCSRDFFYICRSTLIKKIQSWAEATKKQLKENVLKVLLVKADHTKQLLLLKKQKLKLLNTRRSTNYCKVLLYSRTFYFFVTSFKALCSKGCVAHLYFHYYIKLSFHTKQLRLQREQRRFLV